MEIKGNKRPQKFPKVTQTILDDIVTEIKNGAPRKHAAEANGISCRHFHYLIAQGICDLEFGKKDTMFAHLVRSLRRIEINEISKCKDEIRENKLSHKGAEWILEHVYWRDFGPHSENKELAAEIEELRQQIHGEKKDAKANNECSEEDS